MNRDQIFTASLNYFLLPIRPLLDDHDVTEILINGPDQVYVERNGRLELTDIRFSGEDSLRSAVHNIAQYVGREVDEDRPILDARLPDGSRVHAILPPGARHGLCLSIRKFRRDTLSLHDFLRLESITEEAAEFLDLCVKLRKNILIAGGTGTGKTTFLNALSTAIPAEERIVVIEDSSELRLGQPHTVSLESQTPDAAGRGAVTIRQLFVASLRMRPDRIIVGEVRGGEALDMVQSMLSGHAGSLTTVHASSPRDALVRLETLSLMSDVDLPVYVARAQAASAIHLVVQLMRSPQDGRRRVTHITEQMGLDDQNRYTFRDVFRPEAEPAMRGGWRLSPMLEPVSFARELFEQGLAGLVRVTGPLWGG
ncbi:MAG: CpaF family protein [Planctomyces sp.]|nr:CpaF family protein [Planctomyces sp.]